MPEQRSRKPVNCTSDASNCAEIKHLRELAVRELAALREHVELKFKVIQASTDVASQTMNERLESMNEFRNAMKDQATDFVTKSELALRLQNLDSDVRGLREFASEHKGSASTSSVYIAGLIAVVAAVISAFAMWQSN